MASFNQAIVMGHLGQDPRGNQAGTKADFSLATNERRKNPQTGNWEDHTEWHRIVCFGDTATNVVKYLRKGSPALVEGRLQTREYKDRDGNDRRVTEILANRVQFLGSAAGGNGGQDTNRPGAGDVGPSRATSAPAGGGFSGPSQVDDGDDLIF